MSKETCARYAETGRLCRLHRAGYRGKDCSDSDVAVDVFRRWQDRGLGVSPQFAEDLRRRLSLHPNMSARPTKVGS